MHFCIVCDNMYYIKLNENNNELMYYCRNCGHENTSFDQDNIVISKTLIDNQNITKHNVINEYTKLDPTLPRVYNILCINKDCPSNQNEDVQPEVMYIRYDSKNLKYVYLCCNCDTEWNNES